MVTVRSRSVIAGLLGVLVLAAWVPAQAQLRPVSAEVVRVNGRVEAQPKGQTQWTPVAVGARFVEGDQVRALAGGSADLNLPDGSTILIAENTRFAVTKLEYDAQSRERNTALHVVTGKLRAQVSHAAVQLVRTRQSNFSISTPSGVAAVRGTVAIVVYNDVTMETLVFALPSPGQLISAARINYISRSGVSIVVTGGNFTRQVGNQPPSRPTSIGSLSVAAQAALQQVANNATANSTELTNTAVVVLSFQELQTILNVSTTGGQAPGTTGTTGTTSTTSGGTIGRDIQNNTTGTTPTRTGNCPSPPCEP
jgi:hypothetical protein